MKASDRASTSTRLSRERRNTPDIWRRLHLLYLIGDIERSRALTCSFKNGPQWWLALLLLPEEREGITKTEDARKELLEEFENLRVVIPDWAKGQYVELCGVFFGYKQGE